MRKYIYKILIILLCGLSLPLSAQLRAEAQVQPVVILGGGVGALTSAVYLQRAGINTLVIEGQTPGGAIAQSPTVHNWPGEVEIEGQALVEKIRHQAEVNGATILSEEVIDVDVSKRPFTITTRDLFDHDKIRKIQAKATIVALGSNPKLLGVPGESGEKGYWTKGVYSCAVCDGGLYKNKTVAVIGGGDSAILEAEYLSKICKKVYLVVRSNQFRSVETLRKDHLIKKDNVEVLYNTNIHEILGDGNKVTHLKLSTAKQLPIDGVFVAIGATPNSDLFKGKLSLDNNGYITLTSGQQTSIPGVFAIGDVVDPYYKQAISAAGDGAKAALQVERYLATLPSESSSIPQPQVKRTNNNAGMGAVEITSMNDFYGVVNNPATPVVVDFYSPYCGPCKRLSPEIDKLSKKYAGSIRFIKVNIVQFSELAGNFNVYAVPTVMLYQKGKMTDRATGLDDINKLLKKLDSMNQSQ